VVDGDAAPGQSGIIALGDVNPRLAVIHIHVVEAHGAAGISAELLAFDLDAVVGYVADIDIVYDHLGVFDIDPVGIDRGVKIASEDVDRAAVLDSQQAVEIPGAAERALIEAAAFRPVHKYPGIVLVGIDGVKPDGQFRAAHGADGPLDFQLGTVFKQEVDPRLHSEGGTVENTHRSSDLMGIVGHQEGGIGADVSLQHEGGPHSARVKQK